MKKDPQSNRKSSRFFNRSFEPFELVINNSGLLRKRSYDDIKKYNPSNERVSLEKELECPLNEFTIPKIEDFLDKLYTLEQCWPFYFSDQHQDQVEKFKLELSSLKTTISFKLISKIIELYKLKEFELLPKLHHVMNYRYLKVASNLDFIFQTLRSKEFELDLPSLELWRKFWPQEHNEKKIRI